MPKRVVIVDDDPDILLVLEAVLQDGGYEAITLTRGNYLDQIRAVAAPDLILLDVLLSGQDGLQIARALKASEATRHIPILMLSAHPTAAHEARGAGADGFVAKPFDLDELLAVVGAYLS
jgi:DNA-binding response OmpR family regulator